MRKTSCGSLILALCMAACGYHFVRQDRVFGANRIAVVPFAETSAAGMTPVLAAHLARLLAQSGMSLAPQRATADAVLDGSVDYRTTPTASRAGIQTYEVQAAVHAELRDAQGDRLWQHDVQVREDFMPVVGVDVQPMLTENNRRLALQRLAERAAHQVHEALVVASFLEP